MPEDGTQKPASGSPQPEVKPMALFGKQPIMPAQTHQQDKPAEGGPVVPKNIFAAGFQAKAEEPKAAPPASTKVQPAVLKFATSEPQPPAPPQATEVTPTRLSFPASQPTQTAPPAEQLVAPAKIDFGKIAPPPAPPTVKVIAGGIIPKRIEVTVEDLAAIDKNVAEITVLEKARTIVRAFHYEDGRDEKFIDFGLEAQQSYAAESEQLFQAVRDSTIDDVRREIDDIAIMLKSMDCKALLEEKSGGLMSFIFGKKSPEEYRAEFEQKYREMERKINEAKANMPKLRKLVTQFDLFTKKIPISFAEIDAVTVAGKYLQAYGQKLIEEHKVLSQTSQAERLELMTLETVVTVLDKRVASLQVTRISLLQGFEQMRLVRSTVFSLISVIQDTLLVLIPAWRNGYLNVLMILASKKANGQSSATIQEFLALQAEILQKLQI